MSGHSFASGPIIFVMETTTLLPKAKILSARLKLFTLLVVFDKVTVQPFLPSARFKQNSGQYERKKEIYSKKLPADPIRRELASTKL